MLAVMRCFLQLWVLFWIYQKVNLAGGKPKMSQVEASKCRVTRSDLEKEPPSTIPKRPEAQEKLCQHLYEKPPRT